MDTIASQGVEEDGEGSDERLTFTRSHLGNLTLMQYGTTEELYVIVYHLPFQIVTTSGPVVMIDGLVTINCNEVMTWVGSQFAVKICCRNNSFFILCEATCSLLNNSEDLWHHLIECLFVDFEHFFLQFVNLCEDISTLVNRRLFNGCLQFFYLFFLLVSRILHLALDILCALAQCVVVELLNLWIYGFYLFYQWLDEFHVT